MADIGSLAYSATTVPDWSTTTGPGEDEFDYLTLLYIIPLVVLAVLVMVLLALLLVCGLRHMEMWILNHRHQYCTCCNCCNPNLANPDEYRHITREQDPEMYSLNELGSSSSRVKPEEMYATVIIKHDPRAANLFRNKNSANDIQYTGSLRRDRK